MTGAGASCCCRRRLRGFAQQFAVAPTVTLTLGGLAPERLKLASGLFNLMRNLGGAIGIAACGTILNDRTNLHFLRLAEHLNAGQRRPWSACCAGVGGARRRRASAGDAVHGQAAALKQLWSLTLREAQTHDLLPTPSCSSRSASPSPPLMVPLMRKVAPPKGPSSDAH